MAASTTDDWQINKSVLESNKYVLDNQLHCDITFVFQQESSKRKKENDSISAHKFMLITRSPVFCAMFTGPAKDENPEIKIEDVDKESFLEMLNYVYSEDAKLTGFNVLAVLYCAKKYMISGLEKLCGEYLEKTMDHSNVCAILEHAADIGEKSLEEKCLTLLDEVAEEALKSEVFPEITLSTLTKIIKRDTLDVNEIDVYKACVVWAEAECARQSIEATDENKRKVLGEALYLIRFPTIDNDEFCKTVGIAKVLPAEEALDVILHMKVSAGRNQLKFQDTPRVGVWKEILLESIHSLECIRGRSVKQNFTISKGRVAISSVYIINAYNALIDTVYIQDEQGTFDSVRISNLENRTHEGYLQQEVVFDPPARLEAGTHTMYFNNHAGAYFNSTTMQGNPSTEFKDITLSMGSFDITWYFVSGFKLRKY